MNKEQIIVRMKELDEEFNKIKSIVVSGENKMIQIQGAYAELQNMLKNLDKPEEKELEKS